jgi:hypothetical protein
VTRPNTALKYRVVVPMISSAAFFQSRIRTQVPNVYRDGFLPPSTTPAEVERFLALGMVEPVEAGAE